MKPNNMPRTNNKMRTQIVDSLIATTPAVWKKKVVKRDEDGKEVFETIDVAASALRFPLAQNMSDENVERLARKWLPI